ncbi:MAG: hypothetical protein ABW185_20985, partial [Sedimenticola sp.]
MALIIYGWNAVSSVLPSLKTLVISGTHYARSLIGIQLLSEAMQRLQYVEFFAQNGVRKYINQLDILDNLKGDIANKDAATSKTDLKRFVDESTEMM